VGAGALVGHELGGEGAGNLRRHVALHAERVGEMTVVHLGPELGLAGRFDEARGDAHAIVLVPHAAFEQVVGAQRLADVARAQRRALEHHR
jgi:hypothetical protein